MKKSGEELEVYLNREVVIDLINNYLFFGKLTSLGDYYLTLDHCDVHDNSQTTTKKEVYIMESAQYGIRKNRLSVMVPYNNILSVSLLEDVIKYPGSQP